MSVYICHEETAETFSFERFECNIDIANTVQDLVTPIYWKYLNYDTIVEMKTGYTKQTKKTWKPLRKSCNARKLRFKLISN